MPAAEGGAGRSADAAWEAGTRLPHLGGPAAAVRQAIAGHALAAMAHVIEIGGAGLPVTGFLTGAHRSVTVIDPKIAPFEAGELRGRPCHVRHLARKLGDEDADGVAPGTGVALLGLSLKPHGARPAVSEALVRLCRAADIVVIEHSLALERALAQWPELVARAGLDEIWGVDLVLRDGLAEHAGHQRRRLMVLRPSQR